MISKELSSVSVVVRTRNEQATIGIVLQTIISQSLTPQEIILVDNGSTDGTIEIAER